MKNLANCKPTEFVKQTNRIKKSVENWLTVTDIINIRKNLPEPINVNIDATVEERAEALAENKRRIEEQARKNLSAILDAVLGEHPEETLEVLALICFVEPENVDDHSMNEYLQAITEMIEDEAVIGFFTLLGRLGLMNTSTASEA